MGVVGKAAGVLVGPPKLNPYFLSVAKLNFKNSAAVGVVCAISGAGVTDRAISPPT